MSTDRFSATLVAGRSSLTTHATSMPPTRGRHSPAPHRIPRTAPILAGLIAEVPDPPARGARERDQLREYKRAGARFMREQRARLALGHKRYTEWLAVDRTKSTATPKRPRRGTGRSAVA